MFAALLIAALLLAALYSGGMWLWIVVVMIQDRARLSRADLIEFERQAFHLGICFILALGFAGLIMGAR
ncbi:hypothetical protein [Novosphingobium resinovorum]|uniref:Uncharacterized protein n=1 Tax=Novosphingobium resinovorum TaxID=158500 RepID=A0A1D8A529_9SPHN|nr:hypothetical protein [Novosphingobium resinovorum]AOR77214.1 hypothetical protein BES08_10975 [Novosphingobium resinovorum]